MTRVVALCCLVVALFAGVLTTAPAAPPQLHSVGIVHPVEVNGTRSLVHVLAVLRDAEPTKAGMWPEALSAGSPRFDAGVEHSQEHAARWVAYLTGVAPDLEMPYGHLSGTSAGFAWALAGTDVAFGGITGQLTVAATGTISPFGLVSPVGSLPVKLAGAREARVEVVFIPAAQGELVEGAVVIEAWDLREAAAAGRVVGERWDRRPVVVATHHVAGAVGWLCGATGSAGACGALDAVFSAPSLTSGGV